MNYPTTVIHFDFKVNETERQVAEVYVRSLQDAITINAGDDEFLAWIEEEAHQAYARAVNLRNALRYGHIPKTAKNTAPNLDSDLTIL